MDGRQVRVRGVVATLAVVLLVVAACGGGDDDATVTSVAEGGTPVVAEPVGSVGQDPFTEAVEVDEVADFPDAVTATASAAVSRGTVDEATGGVRLAGDEPGLYGGTQDAQACDATQLVDFLTDPANADKAAAFAGALGIEPAAIADTLATYTPVVLTADTLVTNHGFRDGRATPFPAVLEAGTAVLVDGFGIPRVRCACGNPLGAPPDDADLGRTEGDVWDGYDPASTVAVGPSGAVIESLTLTDTTTGDTFQQPPGSGGAPLDVRNTVLPPNACADRDPQVLTTVDGSAELAEGDGGVGGADVVLEPIEEDVDGNGTVDVTFALSCFSCGASCGSYTSVLTVQAGPDGNAVLVGALRGRDGVPVQPESLTLVDGVLTVQGIDFGPGDNEADGPTQPITSQFRFGEGWIPV